MMAQRSRRVSAWRGLAATLAWLAVGTSTAVAAEDPAAPPPWLVDHDAAIVALWERTPPPTDVRFVVGNDLWQPGRTYRSGNDWWALVCAAMQCSLQPAELRTRVAAWQGHYDDQPTSGLQLTFKRTTAGQGRVVAWFRHNATRPWLTGGPVTAYPFGPRRDSPGTWEVAVQAPEGGGEVALVPLLFQGQDRSMAYLQLRRARVRQMLPGTLGDCSGTIARPFLLWAGDLDRDGRVDLLVSYVDADGPVHLYLSGAAAPGQLVGLAGVYHAPPFGGECDGGGWLPR